MKKIMKRIFTLSTLWGLMAVFCLLAIYVDFVVDYLPIKVFLALGFGAIFYLIMFWDSCVRVVPKSPEAEK